MTGVRVSYKRPDNTGNDFKNEATIEVVKDTWPKDLNLNGPEPKEFDRSDVLFPCVQYGGKGHSGNENPKTTPTLKIKLPRGVESDKVWNYSIDLEVGGIIMPGRLPYRPIEDAASDFSKLFKNWMQEILIDGNAVEFEQNPAKPSFFTTAKNKRIFVRNSTGWQGFCHGAKIPDEVQGKIPVGMEFRVKLWKFRDSFERGTKHWASFDKEVPHDSKVIVHEAIIEVNLNPQPTQSPFMGGSGLPTVGPGGSSRPKTQPPSQPQNTAPQSSGAGVGSSGASGPAAKSTGAGVGSPRSMNPPAANMTLHKAAVAGASKVKANQASKAGGSNSKTTAASKVTKSGKGT